MSLAAPKALHPPFDDSHFDAVVVGAGQAGLSMSHVLRQAGIRHVVLCAARNRPP